MRFEKGVYTILYIYILLKAPPHPPPKGRAGLSPLPVAGTKRNHYLCVHGTKHVDMGRFINPFTDVGFKRIFGQEVFTSKMHYIFLELPSFTKEENECETDFERWIYVLKNMETLQRLPFKARSAVFKKLEEIVDIASLSKEERMMYDESIKVYRDKLATLMYARQEGVEEGIEKERLKNARGMKRLGLSAKDIAKVTGLTEAEVEKL